MPRILLVEDEQVNRELFRRRLTAKGFDVLPAESGELAVELAKAEHPDLVLMDLGLPGIDGWEATRQLKADPDTAGIPVIALSAHATPEAKQKATAAGCVEFETKPVQWDALIRKMTAALAGRSLPAPPPPPLSDAVDLFAAGPPTLTADPPVPPGPGTDDLRHPPVLPLPGEPLPAPPAAGAPTLIRKPVRPQPLPEPDEPDLATLQKKRILVVEDNDPNRVMLCRRLMKDGYVTVEARDGREALERVLEYRFDLILLDINMPELDGIQVLRALKSDPDLSVIPVIMISAVDEMATVVKCIEMGAEDYLPKPYDPVLLQARINACLDKRRLRDQELAYLRAVADLTKAAEMVEKGAFDSTVLAPVAGRKDALGTLARVFDKMAREVQARVAQLRQEVARLRVLVEIDEKKKGEELAAAGAKIDELGLDRKAEEVRRRRAERASRRRGEPG
jgi:two-component system cell cycle response regulator